VPQKANEMQDARHKELLGIMIVVLGVILLLASYIVDPSIPFGAYFTTLTVFGVIISVYFERKYYLLKYSLKTNVDTDTH
jgi:hypothetical protein